MPFLAGILLRCSYLLFDFSLLFVPLHLPSHSVSLFSTPFRSSRTLQELGVGLSSAIRSSSTARGFFSFCKVCHQVHNDGDVFRLRCQHFSRGIDFLCKDCSELVGSSWSWIEICREDQHLNLYWSISSASLQCLYGYFHLHSLFWICSSLLLWSSPRKRWWDHSWYHHYSISQHRHGFFRLGPSTAKSSKWVKSRKTRWEERSMLILLFSSFSNQRLHHSQLFLSVQPSHLLSLPTKPWLVSLIGSRQLLAEDPFVLWAYPLAWNSTTSLSLILHVLESKFSTTFVRTFRFASFHHRVFDSLSLSSLSLSLLPLVLHLSNGIQSWNQ